MIKKKPARIHLPKDFRSNTGVSDEYFDELPDKILRRIERRTLDRRFRLSRLAAVAAVFIMLIAVTSIWVLQYNPTPRIPDFTGIDDGLSQTLLMNEYFEPESYLHKSEMAAGLLASAETEAISSALSELSVTLKTIPYEDIERFINETCVSELLTN